MQFNNCEGNSDEVGLNILAEGGLHVLDEASALRLHSLVVIFQNLLRKREIKVRRHSKCLILEDLLNHQI